MQRCVHDVTGISAGGDLQYDGNDHEDDNGAKFQHAGPKLFFCVSQGAEDIDEYDGEPEDGDPNCHTHSGAPIFDSKPGDGQFEG